MSFEASLRRKRYAPRTIRLYVHAMARADEWLRLVGKSLVRASADDLIDYAEACVPFTYASRQTFINAHRAFWRHHLGKGDEGPADSIRCPGRPKMVYRGLDAAEDAYAVIEAAKKWGRGAHAACALCYYAGLRCAETASLPRTADGGEWLHVMGKGAQPRSNWIHEELRGALDGLTVNGSPFFLPGRKPDSHVSPNTVNTWVRLAGAAAGLGHVTPHMLRYTSGAIMLDESGDLRGTGEFLGHSPSSMAVTVGYTRTKRAQARALVETL
jgi:site-specific recombinase XerC